MIILVIESEQIAKLVANIVIFYGKLRKRTFGCVRKAFCKKAR